MGIFGWVEDCLTGVAWGFLPIAISWLIQVILAQPLVPGEQVGIWVSVPAFGLKFLAGIGAPKGGALPRPILAAMQTPLVFTLLTYAMLFLIAWWGFYGRTEWVPGVLAISVFIVALQRVDHARFQLIIPPELRRALIIFYR
jgi:hypothetical protein